MRVGLAILEGPSGLWWFRNAKSFRDENFHGLDRLVTAAAGSSRGWLRCEASVVGSENPAGWTFGRGRSRILSWFAGWKQVWLIMWGGSAVPLQCRIGGTSERICRLTGGVSGTRRVLPLRCRALVGERGDLPPHCAGGLKIGGEYIWI